MCTRFVLYIACICEKVVRSGVFFAVRIQHLRILLYVRKLVRTFAYSCVSGSDILRVMYNLSLNLMDFRMPIVIQVHFLCLYFLNLISLLGRCFSLADCRISMKTL